jgi:CubicO group peptidase (beta-lactamase class C family)
MAAHPGTRWYYSCGDVNVLGEIIKRSTGKMMDEFAEEHLFNPLGISKVEWSFIQPNIIQASGSHYMRSRDVAKFGYLYLNEGKWNDEQILSSSWVEGTMTAYISYSRHGWSDHYGDRYGYQWWLKTYEHRSHIYEAVLRSGWGCQKIVLFPEQKMMIILTGGYYIEAEPVNIIIIDYILPSLN